MPAETALDKFKAKMDEAVQQMSNLCNAPIENSPEGIHYALACAMKNGVATPSEKATAILISTRFMWAHCEYEYHSGE